MMGQMVMNGRDIFFNVDLILTF